MYLLFADGNCVVMNGRVNIVHVKKWERQSSTEKLILIFLYFFQDVCLL